MKIAIINGSIRQGRSSDGVVDWVAAQAAEHGGADFEVVDLAAFNVPLLTSPVIPGMANKQYDDPAVQAWSDAIDAFDGFILVTPEYNHGVPGALKNAFDSLSGEWQRKTIAFVSYGADNGVRAVEQWRQIVANFSMHDIRTQLSLGLFTDFADGKFAPQERRAGEAKNLFDDLLKTTEFFENAN
ncbi:NADPH-dependent FMN reductase [Naumannella halotolerans]|uniref:NAD(P)H-dependent FMN reductase n=1 Tax=Naumannella halotolerans TaxID=993414 RepID=A0A4R7J1D3_9ACTN|nr:NAD(P)H-dependent oxidoreductase [Naumannella halotolerans]TDT30059.1 NAD(P)H-dependent FMN reductase [Naumannella halotolerans]